MYNTKPCSLASLNADLEAGRRKLSLRETPHTMEQGIIRLTDCCNNGGCKFTTEMLAGIHSLSNPVSRAITSDRNTLSTAAIKLVNALLAGLGPSFGPLIPLFVPSLLALCARTSKVFTVPAKDCIFAIIKGTQSPSLLPSLAGSLNHKSASVRLVAADGVLAYLTSLSSLESVNDTRVRLLEDIIKLTARDANAGVRQTAKMIFEAYKNLLPDNVESFISLLSPTTKKHLTVRAAAVPHLTRVPSRIHPTASLHAQKITVTKASDRPTHTLNLDRTQGERATKPIAKSNPAASARQGGLGRPSGPPKEVARVSIAQRSQRVRSMKPRDDESRVRGGTQRVPSLPKIGGAETVQSTQKTCSPAVKPTLVSSSLALGPEISVEAGSISFVKLGACAITTPVADVGSIVLDTTPSPYNVNTQDSKVPRISLASIQGGYLNTPLRVRRDVSRPADRNQRTPRRLRRVSICTERSPFSRNSIITTPSSYSRPIRPLLSRIQNDLPLPSPAQDVGHPSRTDVAPKAESLWRARGAAFAVFKDPEAKPEVVSSNPAPIEECSLFMAGGSQAAAQAAQRSLGAQNATTTPHSDGLQVAAARFSQNSPSTIAERSPLNPPSTIAEQARHHRHPRRQRELPRLWCRGRRPSEFKFLLPMPMSPAKEEALAETTAATTSDHLRHVADFLDIIIA